MCLRYYFFSIISIIAIFINVAAISTTTLQCITRDNETESCGPIDLCPIIWKLPNCKVCCKIVDLKNTQTRIARQLTNDEYAEINVKIKNTKVVLNVSNLEEGTEVTLTLKGDSNIINIKIMSDSIILENKSNTTESSNATKNEETITSTTLTGTPSGESTSPSNFPIDNSEEIANLTVVGNPHRNHVVHQLLLSKDECVLESDIINDFPWMVYFFYGNATVSREKYIFECSGVLLSERYVLTTAFCAGRVTGMFVGLYSNSTCPNSANAIKIEETFLNELEENDQFNFGLLRLNEKIIVSDCAKPICLPLTTTFPKPEQQYELNVSGWQDEYGGAKKMSTHTTLNNQRCSVYYPDKKSNRTNLICTNRNNRGNFHVEAGSPLVYKLNDKWFLYGITVISMDVFGTEIAFGYGGLIGLNIMPDTIEWILDHMKI